MAGEYHISCGRSGGWLQGVFPHKDNIKFLNKVVLKECYHYMYWMKMNGDWLAVMVFIGYYVVVSVDDFVE